MFSQGGPRPLHLWVPRRQAVYEIQVLGARRWAALCAGMCARSGGEASKAAAWVWHMHRQPDYSPVWKMRRRSSSFERSDTRFRQEAASSSMASATPGHLPAPCRPPAAPPQPAMAASVAPPAAVASVWDCSSELYDTFELVSFSNSLDRNLLSAALPTTHGLTADASAPTPPTPSSAASPSPSPSSSRRTFGTYLQPIHHGSNADPPPPHHDRNSSDEIHHASPPADLQGSSFTGRPFAGIHPKFCPLHESVTIKWAVTKLGHCMKKLACASTQSECLRSAGEACRTSSSFRRRDYRDGGTGMPIPQRPIHAPAGSGKNLQEGRHDGLEDNTGDGGEQEIVKVKWRKGVKHYYHHHHHYHHHFVHHVDQSNQTATTNECKLCKLPLTPDVISCQ